MFKIRWKLMWVVLLTLLVPQALAGQARATLAHADSARYDLCTMLYLDLNMAEHAEEKIAGGVARYKMLPVTGAAMSAIADAQLPRADLQITKIELLELPDSVATHRDALLDALKDAAQLLTEYHEELEDSEVGMRSLKAIESVALRVDHLMEEEYQEARQALRRAAGVEAPSALPCSTGEAKLSDLGWD